MVENHRAKLNFKSWVALGISTLALVACANPDAPQQLPTNTPTSPAVLQKGQYFIQREKPVKVGNDIVTFHQYGGGVCTVDINGTDTYIPIDNAQAFPKGSQTAKFEFACLVEKQPDSTVISVFDSASQQ